MLTWGFTYTEALPTKFLHVSCQSRSLAFLISSKKGIRKHGLAYGSKPLALWDKELEACNDIRHENVLGTLNKLQK